MEVLVVAAVEMGGRSCKEAFFEGCKKVESAELKKAVGGRFDGFWDVKVLEFGYEGLPCLSSGF